MAEEEVLAPPGEGIEGVEPRGLREALGAHQGLIVDREGGDVGLVARTVAGVVLQVEPAGHFRVTPVAQPARRVQGSRSGVRRLRRVPARLREQPFGPLEGFEAFGTLGKHGGRDGALEQLARPEQRSEGAVGEGIHQLAPVLLASEGGDRAERHLVAYQVNAQAAGHGVDLGADPRADPPPAQARGTARRELGVAVQAPGEAAGQRVGEPGWHGRWRAGTIDQDLERLGRKQHSEGTHDRHAE